MRNENETIRIKFGRAARDEREGRGLFYRERPRRKDSMHSIFDEHERNDEFYPRHSSRGIFGGSSDVTRD